jgi:hypothetical protein
MHSTMSRRRLRSGGRSASAWVLVALIDYNTMENTNRESRILRRGRSSPYRTAIAWNVIARIAASRKKVALPDNDDPEWVLDSGRRLFARLVAANWNGCNDGR